MPALAHDPPSPRSLATAGLPPRVHRTLERALSLVAIELDDGLSRLVSEFEHALIRRAEQARLSGVESGDTATLHAFRANRDELAPRFLHALEGSIATIRTPAPQRTPDAQETTAFGPLSLVEDTVMDEVTVLGEIAIRQERRATLALHLLGQRFGVLAAAPAFDADHVPLGPQCVCRAIASAARTFEIAHDARLLLYRIFGQVVMPGYARVLERLDAQLADDGILPALTFVPMRVRAEAVDPVDASRPGKAAGAAGSPRRPHLDDAPHQGGGGGAPGSSHADTDATPSHDMAFERLQALMSARRALPRKVAPHSDAPPRRPLAAGEVAEALRQFQPQAHGDERSLVEIKRALLAQARERLGDDVHLAPQDEDVFELLDMLYAHIEQDIRSDAPAAPLLRELRIPMLRAALHDHTVLTRQRHPARELLNTVAESAASWHDDAAVDPRVLAALRAAVDFVAGDDDGDAAVFAEGNARVQAHVQTQARAAELLERRHIEAARGREKLATARARADALVRDIVGDRRLPRFSHALLHQAWADVLTLTLLRHGESSAEAEQQLAMTRRIVEASLDGGPQMDKALRPEVESALGQVGYHGEEATLIAERLTRHLSDEDDDASRTALAMKVEARARLGADADIMRRGTPPPRTPRQQAHYDHLRTLPFGTWIEFTTRQQDDMQGDTAGRAHTGMVRRRMAWYSRSGDQVLFVNQRGQRCGEQSMDAVARLMAAGDARVVTADRGHLLDRAWRSVVGTLRSPAGGDASRDPESRT